MTGRLKRGGWLLAAVLVAAPAACKEHSAAPTGAAPQAPQAAPAAPAPPAAKWAIAHATLVGARGGTMGRVTVSQTPNGVLLQIQAAGLPPGIQAVHIHEVGACEAPSFDSAGGHFNPDSKRHGFAAEGGYHAGDLPNLHVAQDGSAEVEHFLPGVDLASLLDENGSSIVVHAGPDDYRTDPAGHAGNRIACGVLQALEVEPIDVRPR